MKNYNILSLRIVTEFACSVRKIFDQKIDIIGHITTVP